MLVMEHLFAGYERKTAQDFYGSPISNSSRKNSNDNASMRGDPRDHVLRAEDTIEGKLGFEVEVRRYMINHFGGLETEDSLAD